MKLVYIANARIPTEKAHGIQIMKTCAALAAEGCQLELWLPNRRNSKFTEVDPFEYYGVPRNFTIRKFWCLDMIGWLNFLPGVAYIIESKTFAWSISSAAPATSTDTIFYSRDTYPLQTILKHCRPYWYEAHTIEKSTRLAIKRIFKGARGIVTISKNLSEEFKPYQPADRIFVAHDGVDLSQFGQPASKEKARRSLCLPKDDFLAVYTGHLYDWKGAGTFIRAGKYFPAGVHAALIGGTDQDITGMQSIIDQERLLSVALLGHKPPDEIPAYLCAADALVLPNSGRFEISRSHTSPLKLFEYMAAERPIVASDLPSIREILDETCAVFFRPDDAKDLADKLIYIKSNPEIGERLAAVAKTRVQKYSWEARAKAILSFIAATGGA